MELHEKTWLAAAIDGEGCIRIGTHWLRHRSRPRKKRVLYIGSRLIITNTKPAFCERALEISGVGNITVRKHRDSERHNVSFTWTVGKHADLLWLLSEILPYLILKREQAEIVIEYLKLRHGVKQHGQASTRMPREFELVDKIREINRRGTGA